MKTLLNSDFPKKPVCDYKNRKIWIIDELYLGCLGLFYDGLEVLFGQKTVLNLPVRVLGFSFEILMKTPIYSEIPKKLVCAPEIEKY